MPRRAADLLVCSALALASLALYWQSTSFEFINFDDHGYVVHNPHLRAGVAPAALGWTLLPFHSNWVPVTWLSFALDYAAGGLDPAIYHRTNVLLHAAGGVALYLALAALTGARLRSAFVAAVFAVHPLHVESVAWVAERKDVLSGLFFGLCLLAYASYARRPFALGRYALVVLTLGLGLLSKASVVTLPFVLLLLDYWPLHRLRASPRRVWLEKLPLFGMSAGAAAMAGIAAEGSDALDVSFLHRLANAATSYAAYVGRAFWPSGLSIFYPHPAADVSLARATAAAGGLVAVTAAALHLARKRPAVAVGWLWFVGMLVPMIGLVQAGQQAMADRFTYLPLAGLTLALVFAVPERFGETRAGRACLTAAAVLSLGALALVAQYQLQFWRTSTTVFERALDVTDDNAVAHHRLGIELATTGREREAPAHFAEAQRIAPGWGTPALLHGRALAALGDFRGARKQYRRALEAEPGWSQPYLEIARLDIASKRSAKAIRLLERIEEGARGEERAAIHTLLGRAHAASGRFDVAERHYREALALEPSSSASAGYGETHAELGLVLVATGRRAGALEHLEEAARRGHANADAYLALSRFYFESGAEADGIAALRLAVAADPLSAAATNNLAWRLATARDAGLRAPAEALALARQAAALTERSNPEVLDTLAAAHAASGDFESAAATLGEAIALLAPEDDRSRELRRQLARYLRGKP